MKSLLKAIVSRILLFETKLILAKYEPKIIGVTGSVGKTTTKDAVYDVLKDHVHVRKSQKSYNSEIGLPLTVIGADNAWGNIFLWIFIMFKGVWLLIKRVDYPEWLVLEMGADRPGDIKALAQLAKPDIAVMTWLGEVPVHVEFFDSPEALFNEKMEIARALKDGGTLVYNHDDHKLRSLIEGERLPHKQKRYGTEEGADISMSNVSIVYDGDRVHGSSAQVLHAGERSELVIRESLGVQALYAYLAAISVADLLGLSRIRYTRTVASQGRMHALKGIKGSAIIDDSYNASPAATQAALNVLAQVVPDRKKIAVLGDMLELGKYSGEEHRKIGAQAARVADLLVTVGVRAKAIADGAIKAGMPKKAVAEFDDTRLAKEFVREQIKKGDVVLVKGSQGARMERIVERIMLEPHKAKEELVRQDSAWKGR